MADPEEAGVLPQFTRGGPEVPQNRGKSMVEKHLEKMQQEREAAALESLKLDFPDVPPEVRKMSLEACDWDAGEAALKIIEYRRAHPSKKRKGGSSDSESSSDSSSSSSGRKKKSKKEKKSKKDKKEKKGKDKKKKKDKKEKKDREKDKEKKGAVSESQFGRFGARTQNPPPPPCAEPRSSCFHFPCPRTTGYTDARLFPARDLRRHCPPAGIIRETDINEKRAEFCSWLTEVKGLNPEALAKWEEKDHFKSYMEDYNTATLPSKKYYNIEAWHREEQIRAAREGRDTTKREVDFGNLEGQRKADMAQMQAQDEAEKRKRLLEHMKLTGKIDGLKEQERLKSELKMAASVGDHEKVRQIQAKLAPDDPRDSLAARNYGFRPS